MERWISNVLVTRLPPSPCILCCIPYNFSRVELLSLQLSICCHSNASLASTSVCDLPLCHSLALPRRKIDIKASSDAPALTTPVRSCLTERIMHKGLLHLKPPPPYHIQSHRGSGQNFRV